MSDTPPGGPGVSPEDYGGPEVPPVEPAGLGVSPEPEGLPERPPSERQARPSRSFALSMLGATARGTGLVALAVAIGIVLLQYSDNGEERLAGGREPTGIVPAAGVAGIPSSSTTASTTSTTAGPRTPAELTVLVLNASGRGNQAKPMSERLGVVGYRTLKPGNAPRRPDSVVLCQPGLEREAPALVAATGLPAKAEPLPADTTLPGADKADCIVVIGSR